MIPSQIHKRINFNFEKQKLIFDTSRLLFSFAKVDDGTKAFLNSLRKNKEINHKEILDLGCGYGAISIFLKKQFPDSIVHATDRDSLAVEFAKHNSELNDVKIEAYVSLDLQNIKEKFSLILCNFPAKLEKKGLEYFIEKSSEFLTQNGTLAIVVVTELEKDAEEILKNEKIIIQSREKIKGYSIYHLMFKEKIIPKEFSYFANKLEVNLGGNNLDVVTTDALREFDTPHFISELIFEMVENKNINGKTVTILNPNQGFIPIFIMKNIDSGKIVLTSRDLVQLEVSAKNLELNSFNNFEKINSDFPQNKSDLLIWSVHDEDAAEVCEKLEILRKNHKQIILGARLQIINRVLDKLKIEPKEILKKTKYCAVLI